MKTVFLLPLMMVASVTTHAASRTYTAAPPMKCEAINGTFTDMQAQGSSITARSVEYNNRMIYSFGSGLVYADGQKHKAIDSNGKDTGMTYVANCTANGVVIQAERGKESAKTEIMIINANGDISMKMSSKSEGLERIFVKNSTGNASKE